MAAQTSQENQKVQNVQNDRTAGALLLADFLKLPPDDMKGAWSGGHSVYRERYLALPTAEQGQFDLRLCATVLAIACEALRATLRCLADNGDLSNVFKKLDYANDLQSAFINFSSPRTNLSGKAALALWENIEHDMTGKFALVRHDIQYLDLGYSLESERMNGLNTRIQFCLAVLTAQRALLYGEVQLQETDPVSCLRLAVSELDEIGAMVVNGEVEQNGSDKNHIQLFIQTAGQQIYADPNVLTLALFNVIKNAVRVNSDGRELRIEVAVTNVDDDSRTRITVRDNGRGLDYDKIREALAKSAGTASITDEKISRSLFTRGFSPGGKSTGLGLSIVRSLIEEQLSGEVSIANQPQGGAIVTIFLPQKKQL